MRWRDRKRAAIIEALCDSCVVRLTDRREIAASAECLRLRERDIKLSCILDQISCDDLYLDAQRTVSGLSLKLDARRAPMEIQAVVCLGDPQAFDGVQCTVVDPRITVPPLEKFSFERRSEPTGLFTPHDGIPARKIPRAPGGSIPAPHPDDTTTTLEERLRWILTPPIHEVLSDPSLGLPETPYPFQVKGICWLLGKESALLADEMGLGKTMQAIIAARLLWREQRISRILVVCPASLIATSWRPEIKRWWRGAEDNIRICDAGEDIQRFLKLATPNITIKIVSYDKVARAVEWLTEGDCCGSHDLIIIDEAQRIKNPDSKTARAVKALVGKRRWALTGTPLETKPGDVVSIFEFLRPGLLESDDPTYVRERIRPFFLRRRTDEVMQDLPEMDVRDVDIELTDTQRQAYDRAELEGVIQLNEKGETVTLQHVFALIQKLMQLCNFEPRTGESTKLDRLEEDLEEIIDSGRKVLIFSQFVAEPFGLKSVVKRLPSYCHPAEWHGKIPMGKRNVTFDQFDKDPTPNLLLLQFRAGGQGLNLQAANYVYLFDRWWNPAVEDQAIKRAHRIGQKNKVFVRRFYCRNTIEERILDKLAQRRRLFSYVIDENRPLESVPLGEEEFFSLFSNLKARPKRSQAPPKAPLLILDNMGWEEFQILSRDLYHAQGYEAKVVGRGPDEGIDVLAEKTVGAARERIAIQCKHQKASVGRPEVQKLYGVLSADQTLTQGHFVTSSDFSAQAREFASGKRIFLINREQLIGLVTKHGVATFATGTGA